MWRGQRGFLLTPSLSCVAVGFQHVWSESEDCLPFLQLAQDYISSCGKKTLHEILEKVFKSFRPVSASYLLLNFSCLWLSVQWYWMGQSSSSSYFSSQCPCAGVLAHQSLSGICRLLLGSHLPSYFQLWMRENEMPAWGGKPTGAAAGGMQSLHGDGIAASQERGTSQDFAPEWFPGAVSWGFCKDTSDGSAFALRMTATWCLLTPF